METRVSDRRKLQLPATPNQRDRESRLIGGRSSDRRVRGTHLSFGRDQIRAELTLEFDDEGAKAEVVVVGAEGDASQRQRKPDRPEPDPTFKINARNP